LHLNDAKNPFCTIMDYIWRANIGIARKRCIRQTEERGLPHYGAWIFRFMCAPVKGFAPSRRMSGTEAALSVAIDRDRPASAINAAQCGTPARPDQQNWEGGNVRRNR
jgi:hypothetical protein